MSLAVAREVLRVESEALATLADRLGQPFELAVERIAAARNTAGGRVALAGIGKSGWVARKIAATLSSTGTPAYFIHPSEALHGDLGMLVEGDVALLLSQSGETAELVGMLEPLRRLGNPILAMTGHPASTIAREVDIVLDTSVGSEGCPLNLAPMASTTVMIALGDALAAALMTRQGFGAEDFARLHPAGGLGRKLARVQQLMHRDEALPKVAPETLVRQAVLEISRKRLGCTTVVDPSGALCGLLTDGDLRRLLERDPTPLDRRVDQVMTRTPLTVRPELLATAALRLMEERKITMLPVVDDAGRLQGIIQIHDLWRTGLF